MGVAVGVARSFRRDPGPSHAVTSFLPQRVLATPPGLAGVPCSVSQREGRARPIRSWALHLQTLSPGQRAWVRTHRQDWPGPSPAHGPGQPRQQGELGQAGGRRAGDGVCPPRQGVMEMPRMLIASACRAGRKRGLDVLPPAPSAQGASEMEGSGLLISRQPPSSGEIMGPRLYVLSAPRIMGSRCSQWGPSGEGFLEPAGEPRSLTTAVLPLARTFRGCPALCGTVGRALWPLLRLSGGNAAARALGKEPAGRCLRTLAGPRGTGGRGRQFRTRILGV